MFSFIKNNLSLLYGIVLGSLLTVTIFFFNNFFNGDLKKQLLVLEGKYSEAITINGKISKDFNELQQNYDKVLNDLNSYHTKNKKLTKEYNNILRKKDIVIEKVRSVSVDSKDINTSLGVTEAQALEISLANFNALRETYEVFRDKGAKNVN